MKKSKRTDIKKLKKPLLTVQVQECRLTSAISAVNQTKNKSELVCELAMENWKFSHFFPMFALQQLHDWVCN